MTKEETLNYVLPAGKVLVLRTSDKDRKSYGDFQWPESGYVEAADYKPTKECGNGLHGALRGEGAGNLLNWDEEAVWQVVEVDDNAEIIDLYGNVKFRCGNVIYSGDRKTATDLVRRVHGGAVIGATVTGGDWATVTGGDWATVTGGDWATVTGGNEATVTGGNRARVTGGDWATVTGGNWATVTGGYGARVTGGDEATVTGGNLATVTGGYGARVTGGNLAILHLGWHDGNRYRVATVFVGEDGIKANTAYRINGGKFVEAS